MLIHDYAEDGDVEGVTNELKNGVNIDEIDERGFTPLAWAIRSGNIELVTHLIEAGADVKYIRKHNYDALIDAVFSRNLTVTLVELLIQNGVNPSGVSTFGESALSVASNQGRFDVIDTLLKSGADESILKWTALMKAIALGSLSDCKELLKTNADLNARDSWERTPWLLTLQTGDVNKAILLLETGANKEDRGRCGKLPLVYAIENNHLELLHWLLSEGFDPDMVDDYQESALMKAAGAGTSESVKILLEAGANAFLENHTQTTAIQSASTVDVARLLISAGADLNDIDDEVRAALTKLPNDEKLLVEEEEFKLNMHRRFGNGNPQKMNFPFWMDMIRSGASASQVRSHFKTEPEEPIWSFKRFGKSINELLDGRIIEIAGEHEDWYDDDFCIYNDVIVHFGDGSFDIYGYPENVFPPTDFHSATLVGKYIYIIGTIGYPQGRVPGETPVFKLDCESFEIQKVETTGTKPGWINRHKAKYIDEHKIQITGGQILINAGGRETFKVNQDSFVLDTHSLAWQLASGSKY